MRRIALTIDTDFFVRELLEWDFGHSEENPMFMSDFVWNSRYHSILLHKETNPKKYADCRPRDLILDLLWNGGLDTSEDVITGAGWSHMFAYDMFKDIDFDTLVNFDAHHDCWDWHGKKLDCGNWVTKLKSKKSFKYYWGTPKWLDADIYGKKYLKHVDSMFTLPYLFNSQLLKGGEIVAIYIAQSPAWVPPHHDKLFLELISAVKYMTTSHQIDFDKGVALRKHVTRKEAENAYRIHQRSIKELNKLTNIFELKKKNISK